jgi:hypothetical protein
VSCLESAVSEISLVPAGGWVLSCRLGVANGLWVHATGKKVQLL